MMNNSEKKATEKIDDEKKAIINFEERLGLPGGDVDVPEDMLLELKKEGLVERPAKTGASFNEHKIKNVKERK